MAHARWRDCDRAQCQSAARSLGSAHEINQSFALDAHLLGGGDWRSAGRCRDGGVLQQRHQFGNGGGWIGRDCDRDGELHLYFYCYVEFE
jgi:hypothetical protein